VPPCRLAFDLLICQGAPDNALARYQRQLTKAVLLLPPSSLFKISKENKMTQANAKSIRSAATEGLRSVTETATLPTQSTTVRVPKCPRRAPKTNGEQVMARTVISKTANKREYAAVGTEQTKPAMDTVTRKARFRRLAKALAIVLQHPATPAVYVNSFNRIARIVAIQASIAPTTLAVMGRDAARFDAHKLFLEFGLAFADVLDDDDLDSAVWNELGDCTGEVEELLRPENGREAEAARLRGVVKEFARVLAQPWPPKPAPTTTEQIFRRFTKATVALLAHPDSPERLCDAIGDALRDVGNDLGAFDVSPDVEARRVLSHVFRLSNKRRRGNVQPA
jgi:hypothetical protein